MGISAHQFTSTGGNYVKADDVKAGPQLFTVENVEVAKLPDGKPALQLVFRGGKKLTLNKTNARILASMIGDDTDLWKGRALVVSFDPTVMYAGKMVGGVRVRPQDQAQAQPPAVQAAVASANAQIETIKASVTPPAPASDGFSDVGF
jgi:hypothetical protein